ncbi:glycerophosphodiester phosphodiesterase family protein [Nocardioides sp. YIM 152315]|nr:glycerophosphodiester phosphodiesterase family protein [Nocardioides sp. YIM 152315]
MATSPLALLVLVAVVAVTTVFVLADVILFAVIGRLSLECEPVTFTSVLRRSRTTVAKAVSWQGLLLVPYLTIVLPISEFGFSSVLTQYVALPEFISGELLKTTSGAVLYVAAMGVIVYFMMRFLLFPAIVSGGDHSIVGSLRGSFRMTRWRPLHGIGAVMLAAVLVGFLALSLLAAIGLLPVALVGTHAAAGVALDLLDLARFLVVGAVTAFLAFFFVAYVRLAQGDPVEVAPAYGGSRGTRAASVTLVVPAGFLATPKVLAAADAAALTAESTPDIIGHRGYPAKAVENSIAGLRRAARAGADMVETDIQETRDGGLVVMHDVGLGRLTQSDENVYELTEAEVTSLTLRQDGRTASIPTLVEFVRQADRLGVRLLVEVKPHGGRARARSSCHRRTGPAGSRPHPHDPVAGPGADRGDRPPRPGPPHGVRGGLPDRRPPCHERRWCDRDRGLVLPRTDVGGGQGEGARSVRLDRERSCRSERLPGARRGRHHHRRSRPSSRSQGADGFGTGRALPRARPRAGRHRAGARMTGASVDSSHDQRHPTQTRSIVFPIRKP